MAIFQPIHSYGNGTASVLRSLPMLNRLSGANSSATRVNNLNVYDAENVSICHLVHFDIGSLDPSSVQQGKLAVAMALEHLNTANPSVVLELERLQCGNMKFTTESIVASDLDEQEGINAIFDTLVRTDHRPCAFLGQASTKLTATAAALTSLHNFAQVSPVSMAPSSVLSEDDEHPLLASLYSSVETRNLPVLDYIYNVLLIRFLIVVQPTGHLSDLIRISYQNYARQRYPKLNLKFVPASADALLRAVDLVDSIGSRYVLVMLEGSELETFMRHAFTRGIAGSSEYMWIATSDVFQQRARTFNPNDDFLLATKGMLQFSANDASDTFHAPHEAFVNAFQNVVENPMNHDFISGVAGNYSLVDSSQMLDVHRQTAILYDSAILLGVAACQARENLTGTNHHSAILNSAFQGASGSIALDPSTRSLKFTSLNSVIKFISPRKAVGGESYVLHGETVAHFQEGNWIPTGPSFQLPHELPIVAVNYNYIGVDLRGLGFVLSTIVVGFSIVFGSWTIICRGRCRVIRASQPIFLLLITIGTTLMGLSIVPLSMDDEIFPDPPCMAFPWLLSLGWCFAFSALFSKTRRINLIFHQPSFNRIQVSVHDVMVPMAILLFGKIFIAGTYFLGCALTSCL